MSNRIDRWKAGVDGFARSLATKVRRRRPGMQWMRTFASLLAMGLLAGGVYQAQAQEGASEGGLRMATFDMDVTPPLGSHLAYDTMKQTWDMGLRARGIVIEGGGAPIVLCAVDWIGIGNGAYEAFRKGLAAAAGTDVSRVAIHTLHQHDAPACDFSAEEILRSAGLEPLAYDGTFAREVLVRLKGVVGEARQRLQPLTHISHGSARVFQVASNRRILGEDGRVRVTRYTATVDPAIRAEPEGVIDPLVTVVGLWSGEKPIAVLSYYAVHPQSYYRTGVANPDFPGLARFIRQLEVPSALHVHFTGAGGNLGAGKYNDGSHENRGLLARRLADGMRRAWESSQKEEVSPDMLAWSVASVALPTGSHLVEEQLEAQLAGRDAAFFLHGGASRLAWLRRNRAGNKVDVQCLSLGSVRLLHLPGELFVEYQLAARAMRPELTVGVAAYGDYGPGYVGTAVAYEQGGYETSAPATNVDARTEAILLDAIRKVLSVE